MLTYQGKDLFITSVDTENSIIFGELVLQAEVKDGEEVVSYASSELVRHDFATSALTEMISGKPEYVEQDVYDLLLLETETIFGFPASEITEKV